MRSQGDFDVVGLAAAPLDAVSLVGRALPAVVLLDGEIPGEGHEYLLQAIPGVSPASRVILLTGASAEPDVVRAVQSGVVGLIPKTASAELVFKAIRAVAEGEYWLGRHHISRLARAMTGPAPAVAATKRVNLTLREYDVLAAVAIGCSNKEVAAQLGLSVQTIKHHLTSIFNKTGMSTRLELALFAASHGLTTAPRSAAV